MARADLGGGKDCALRAAIPVSEPLLDVGRVVIVEVQLQTDRCCVHLGDGRRKRVQRGGCRRSKRIARFVAKVALSAQGSPFFLARLAKVSR